MAAADLLALLPIIVVSATALVVMLTAAFYRSHRFALALTVIGLAAAMTASWATDVHGARQITPLLIVDGYAAFFMGLVCFSGLAVALLAYEYLERGAGRPEEFYVLLLLATVGSLVLVASNHFASLFLGLEILSVALYALIAYERVEPSGIEAGLKYLVLAATSAAFLLFGMALVYAQSGDLSFSQFTREASAPAISAILLPAGLALMIVGIGFKLALVPFHLWTPDIYQGAPAPAAAFIATASKGAMFVVLLRLFRQPHVQLPGGLLAMFTTIAVASMFTGNLLALLQSNVKRILAYSSIAHLGYLLVAFLASGPLADAAVAYYLVAYFLSMLGAFGVVGVLSSEHHDADALSDYQGLAWRRPWLATAMVAMLLSLAGIPLTAGFLAKFYVLAAGAASSLWWLVLILVVNSAIGLFYYLRVMIAMFATAPVSGYIAPTRRGLAALPYAGLALTVLTLLLVWLGIDPAMLIQAIAGMVPGPK